MNFNEQIGVTTSKRGTIHTCTYICTILMSTQQNHMNRDSSLSDIIMMMHANLIYLYT